MIVDFGQAEPMMGQGGIGQSGNPASPNYANGIDPSLKAQYLSFPMQPQNFDKVYGKTRSDPDPRAEPRPPTKGSPSGAGLAPGLAKPPQTRARRGVSNTGRLDSGGFATQRGASPLTTTALRDFRCARPENGALIFQCPIRASPTLGEDSFVPFKTTIRNYGSEIATGVGSDTVQ